MPKPIVWKYLSLEHMRKLLLVTLYLLSLVSIVEAQQGIYNGDLELWRRREFRCCGRNVDLPQSWGIPEQSCGLNFNKFVYLETDSTLAHSGKFCAKMVSDTTFFNNVVLEPGILIYGGYPNPYDSTVTIGQTITPDQNGLPIDSNPMGLRFWLKMSHDLSDTFTYVYVLTRWDSVTHQEDTLAYASKDISDTHVPAQQWFSVTDSILYRHPGHADSLRLIFYGGRSGNPDLKGNVTWIDDISFYYETPQLTTAMDVAEPTQTLSIYPNPAKDILHISCEGLSEAISTEIMDDLGRVVVRSALGSIDVRGLSVGCYICRISDATHLSLYQERFSIVR